MRLGQRAGGEVAPGKARARSRDGESGQPHSTTFGTA
jgi:hypothetical protein